MVSLSLQEIDNIGEPYCELYSYTKARGMERFDGLDDDYLYRVFRLYKISRLRLEVEIISGEMEVVNHLPEHLAKIR